MEEGDVADAAILMLRIFDNLAAFIESSFDQQTVVGPGGGEAADCAVGGVGGSGRGRCSGVVDEHEHQRIAAAFAEYLAAARGLVAQG